ncbi:hypothetical protein HDZ31DRAFT_61704 [Schizophyllum fasciatum]
MSEGPGCIRAWLDNPKAYYDEGRPLCALKTIKAVFGLSEDQFFHVNMGLNADPRVGAFKAVMEVVQKYADYFPPGTVEQWTLQYLLQAVDPVHTRQAPPMPAMQMAMAQQQQQQQSISTAASPVHFAAGRTQQPPAAQSPVGGSMPVSQPARPMQVQIPAANQPHAQQHATPQPSMPPASSPVQSTIVPPAAASIPPLAATPTPLAPPAAIVSPVIASAAAASSSTMPPQSATPPAHPAQSASAPPPTQSNSAPAPKPHRPGKKKMDAETRRRLLQVEASRREQRTAQNSSPRATQSPQPGAAQSPVAGTMQSPQIPTTQDPQTRTTQSPQMGNAQSPQTQPVQSPRLGMAQSPGPQMRTSRQSTPAQAVRPTASVSPAAARAPSRLSATPMQEVVAAPEHDATPAPAREDVDMEDGTKQVAEDTQTPAQEAPVAKEMEAFDPSTKFVADASDADVHAPSKMEVDDAEPESPLASLPQEPIAQNLPESLTQGPSPPPSGFETLSPDPRVRATPALDQIPALSEAIQRDPTPVPPPDDVGLLVCSYKFSYESAISYCTFHWDMTPQQMLGAKAWNSRAKCTTDFARAYRDVLCLSIGCYIAPHDPKPKSGAGSDKLHHITSVRPTWPSSNLCMTLNEVEGEPLVSLSPPFKLTPDGLYDLTLYAKEGKNRATVRLYRAPDDKADYIIHLYGHRPSATQVEEVVQGQRTMADWTETLASMAKPFDFEFSLPGVGVGA